MSQPNQESGEESNRESFDDDSLDDDRQSVVGSRSPHQLVHRLIGMETEYATLVADSYAVDQHEMLGVDLPSSHSIYQAICDAIRREQPTGHGIYDSEQLFLASGGAITFESHPTLHSLPGGLIEIASPEVRSPDELLACQRSIDAMIADAAANIDMPVDLRVLKNSSDAFGHVYGCQENYETVVATGAWLVIYRLFVSLLWIVQVISLIVSLPILGILYLSGAVYRKLRRPTSSAHAATSETSSDPPSASESDAPVWDEVPRWLTATVIMLFRIIHFPTVVILKFVVRRIAFRQQRKYLTAFLASRVALCGSGNLDHNACFSMSPKAMAIDVLADLGGFRGERPVFVFGHWLTQFSAKSFLSLSSTRQMFRRHQRLQIGLTDSNMADLAEYVKVGSTSLLLDMIEQRRTADFPTITRKTIDIMHRLAGDWNLIARVKTSHGKLSALEIQKKYLRSAHAFVDATPESQRGEAPVVLERWQQLYDCVYAFRRNAAAVEDSIGQVDWLTKHWLMDQIEGEVDWSDRKKVDLRYHELSHDGYYFRIMQHYPQLRLISAKRIQRRRRSPPPDSPAARRGWLIREFASSDQAPQYDWSHAMIGTGRDRKRIEFIQPS